MDFCSSALPAPLHAEILLWWKMGKDEQSGYSTYYKREKKNNEGKVIYRKSLHYHKAAQTLCSPNNVFVINLELLRLGWPILQLFYIQW